MDLRSQSPTLRGAMGSYETPLDVVNRDNPIPIISNTNLEAVYSIVSIVSYYIVSIQLYHIILYLFILGPSHDGSLRDGNSWLVF